MNHDFGGAIMNHDIEEVLHTKNSARKEKRKKKLKTVPFRVFREVRRGHDEEN